MSQRDERLAEQFALLRSQGARTRILLALSAASDLQTLDELVTTYADVQPAACVLTKLDEAASLGAAISVLDPPPPAAGVVQQRPAGAGGHSRSP